MSGPGSFSRPWNCRKWVEAWWGESRPTVVSVSPSTPDPPVREGVIVAYRILGTHIDEPVVVGDPRDVHREHAGVLRGDQHHRPAGGSIIDGLGVGGYGGAGEARQSGHHRQHNRRGPQPPQARGSQPPPPPPRITASQRPRRSPHHRNPLNIIGGTLLAHRQHMSTSYTTNVNKAERKTNGDGPGWLSMALTVGVDRLRGRPRGFEAASMLSAGLVL